MKKNKKVEIKAVSKDLKQDEVHALEHLIEETLRSAYFDKSISDDAAGKTHAAVAGSEAKLKSREEKLKEFREQIKTEESTFKIKGVRRDDGSECCGGSCCDDLTKKYKPVLSKKQYFELINNVLDPETGIGISDMGLIYDVEEHENGLVEITMTLTSMGCPAGGQITSEIDSWLRLQKHIKDVKIEVVWEPAWNPGMMNPDIRAMMFGNSPSSSGSGWTEI